MECQKWICTFLSLFSRSLRVTYFLIFSRCFSLADMFIIHKYILRSFLIYSEHALFDVCSVVNNGVKIVEIERTRLWWEALWRVGRGGGRDEGREGVQACGRHRRSAARGGAT